MNKKYRIYWLLNASVDVKVSISPRVEMLKELEKIGNKIILIATYKKKKLQIDVDTTYIRTTNTAFLARIHYLFKSGRKISKELKSSVERVILIADQNSLYSALFIKLKLKILQKKNIKVHFDIRTIPVEVKGLKGWIDNMIFWYPALKLAYRFADSFSFISHEIEKIADINHKKCCIWSSGVNINKFKVVNREIKQNRLFYHGVITANRGLRETIIAIDQIKNYITNFKFVIVGDGPDLGNLNRMIRNRQLEDYVELKGRVDYKDIQLFIKEAKVCICPLPDILWWKVSSPLKVIEYMAMGKPCILTEITPHKKLINSDLKGIYWAGKGTPEDIAKSIIKAFKDEHNFKNYRKDLRKIAEKNTWEKKAKKLVEYWNNSYLEK